jgi:hypothetical protein
MPPPLPGALLSRGEVPLVVAVAVLSQHGGAMAAAAPGLRLLPLLLLCLPLPSKSAAVRRRRQRWASTPGKHCLLQLLPLLSMAGQPATILLCCLPQLLLPLLRGPPLACAAWQVRCHLTVGMQTQPAVSCRSPL